MMILAAVAPRIVLGFFDWLGICYEGLASAAAQASCARWDLGRSSRDFRIALLDEDYCLLDLHQSFWDYDLHTDH